MGGHLIIFCYISHPAIATIAISGFHLRAFLSPFLGNFLRAWGGRRWETGSCEGAEADIIIIRFRAWYEGEGPWSDPIEGYPESGVECSVYRYKNHISTAEGTENRRESNQIVREMRFMM